jgi:hypothetical protein
MIWMRRRQLLPLSKVLAAVRYQEVDRRRPTKQSEAEREDMEKKKSEGEFISRALIAIFGGLPEIIESLSSRQRGVLHHCRSQQLRGIVETACKYFGIRTCAGLFSVHRLCESRHRGPFSSRRSRLVLQNVLLPTIFPQHTRWHDNEGEHGVY